MTTPRSVPARAGLGLADASLIGAAFFVASLASGAVLAVVNYMFFAHAQAKVGQAQAAAMAATPPPTWVDPQSPTNTWATDAAAAWPIPTE